MLNRFRNGKEEVMIGQSMLPFDVDPEIENYNINKLTAMINAGNCFDFETEFQLVLSFNRERKYQGEKIYVFEYNDHQWKSIESVPSMLNWYHDTIRKGFILKV